MSGRLRCLQVTEKICSYPVNFAGFIPGERKADHQC
jgi:hypothetical protein